MYYVRQDHAAQYDYELKEQGNSYIAQMEIAELKEVSQKLDILKKIDADIKKSCDNSNYIKALSSRKELKQQISVHQKCNIAFDKLNAQYEKWQAVINESETLEKIAEYLDVKDTKNIKADDLKKRADGLDDKKKKRFAKKYSEWLKAFEDLNDLRPKWKKAKESLEKARKEVVTVIIAKVPLKDLYKEKREYQFSCPLEKEKSNAEKQLKDIEAKLKAEIENGSLQLQYAGETYDQFAIKALKQ